MKKIILLAGIAVLSFTTQAQISKGRSMLGGSARFNQRNTNTTQPNLPDQNISKSTGIGTEMSYGYLFTDHLMAGLQFGFNYNHYNGDQNGARYSISYESKTTLYVPGIFARYYRQIKGSRFYFFVQLAGTYAIGTGISTDNSVGNVPSKDESELNALDIYLTPGVVYMINNKIGIETKIGRLGHSTQSTKRISQGKETDKTRDNNTYADFSFSTITLGVNFYFGGKGN